MIVLGIIIGAIGATVFIFVSAWAHNRRVVSVQLQRAVSAYMDARGRHDQGETGYRTSAGDAQPTKLDDALRGLNHALDAWLE